MEVFKSIETGFAFASVQFCSFNSVVVLIRK